MLDHFDYVVIGQGLVFTALCYWIMVTLYTLIPILFPEYAARYKLQPAPKPMSAKTNIGLILLTLFNQTVLLFLVFATAGTLFFSLGGRVPLEFPAWYMVMFHFLIYAAIFEVLFYFSHRLLHTRWLFRWVHGLHHRFRAPVPYSGACVHPVEFLLSYAVPSLLPAILFQFSVPEILLFLAFEYMHNVHDHSGYDYPWDPFGLVFGQNARMHDEHHRLFRVNYSGAFTMVLDRLFRTYRPPQGEAH